MKEIHIKDNEIFNLRDLYSDPKPTDVLQVFLDIRNGSPVVTIRARDCKHKDPGPHHDCRIPEGDSPFDNHDQEGK